MMEQIENTAIHQYVSKTQGNTQYQYPQPVISQPIQPQYIFNQLEQSSNDNMTLTLSMIISISPLAYERSLPTTNSIEKSQEIISLIDKNSTDTYKDYIYIFAAGFIVDNFNRMFIVQNMFIRTILNTIMLHIIFKWSDLKQRDINNITGHLAKAYPKIADQINSIRA